MVVNITASSQMGENLARNAFDGRLFTRWESEHGVDLGWICFEFKEEVVLEDVLIKWETASAKVYDVLCSKDGSDWKNVASIADGREGEIRLIRFPPEKTRFLKIFGKERVTKYGYSIWEISFNVGKIPESNITASSTKGGNYPEFAFDGNPATRWDSAQGIDPAWIKKKFDKKEEIKGVIIKWERASASVYEIQVSDDNDKWKTVARIEDGKEDEERVIKFVPRSALYLRIYGEERTTEYGYSIFEVEILK